MLGWNMEFNIPINTPEGEKTITINSGETIFFVGANGSGKTRLATKIEELQGVGCHRISAHRALTLNLGISKISRKKAESSLFYGHENYQSHAERMHGRWGQKTATHLLNDFDQLLQVLFAEQNDTALETHMAARNKIFEEAKETRFEVLKDVWERLLPQRKLSMTGDSISVSPPEGGSYSAEEMSDGERSVFYLVGQVLCVKESSLIIFDEPELHIHRSILSNLWDELQALRPDCAFVMISHDLEFVAKRTGRKYVLDAFTVPDTWSISEVPSDSGFSEELTTLILGSRNPILFVEGELQSLDFSIYRSCYPDWNVVPRGSCENVIQSVRVFSDNDKLTRIGCAGIIDADDRTPEQIKKLLKSNVYILPVSEIENLILLPNIVKEICVLEACNEAEIEGRKNALYGDIFSVHEDDKNKASIGYVRRRIDREFKKISLSGISDIDELSNKFNEEISNLNIGDIGSEYLVELNKSIADGEIKKFLALYDNKGLVALAGKYLANKSKTNFQEWIARKLNARGKSALKAAFIGELPSISSPE